MTDDQTVFSDESVSERYTALAETLGTDIYRDAVNLRNKWADTTATYELRRDGRELTESLNEAVSETEALLECLADTVDSVETEYMVSEGWELSYYDPDELPDDLVMACRIHEAVLYARGEIDWLFNEALGGGVPEKEEIPMAADRVCEQFPHLAHQFDRAGIEVPNVEPDHPTAR